ncbi:YcjF family protein [Nodularia sphaerocarpa]|uniref:YcjF family protein n=1 Tax=Nodularia sphaerocarpa TaxID=137816 RepID=UPI001EFA6B58|nr:GTP-binding protein [Nodularia sphaerocarpa]MDB9375861.1 GTP-binding protein [Nodularia sphaerocarpa CS-585]MDB9378605.1 GTP-binding protein [Nodularia sphaerocarpa CS-585A2]ULP71822.1 tRNA modification GTPase MnmE [Nodularia sphaerocarpa UHCC 0038]
MPLSRIVTLIVGLIVILGLSLWLIDSLSRLYWQLSYSPLLGNLLLLLLVLLIGGLVAAFVYYVLILQAGEKKSHRQRRRVTAAEIPAAKSDAASTTLKAVKQQVAQIQDEVARQALLSKSREIEVNLARGEIQVVVFGTGSAGKTSLVNAIMGRMVGQVNAPMGTTQVGETYCLRLKGLERKILITDTPGILEAGVEGTEREQLARELATSADLLLFVVDNDLRRSEYEPLRSLAEIGKRSLLVLNKTDLYTDEDTESILARLRQRVRGFIPPNDVVAIAGNPQPAMLETGETYQPEPDIIPLLRRMAAILRAEGEDLVADNILLQSLRLGEEARNLIDVQRRRQADKIVDRFQWIGAGVVSVTPLPVVDLLATAAVNAQMVVEIARIYGCELNMERGKELALSLGKTIASLGIVKGAIQLISTALQFHVATFVIGRAIQGVTVAYLTRIAGKSFIEYFRHDQDWGDGGMTEVVKEQFKLNRRDEFIKTFIQEAIARVVKPLTNHAEVIEQDEEAKT